MSMAASTLRYSNFMLIWILHKLVKSFMRLINHKNDKKLKLLLFDAFSASVSMEKSPKLETCQIPKLETK